MAVTHEQKLDPERGVYYEIDLSASGDVAQAQLVPGDLKGKLDWLNGKVSWHKGASVNASFTTLARTDWLAAPAMAWPWVAHPDNSTQASETMVASRPAPSKRLLLLNWPLVLVMLGLLTNSMAQASETPYGPRSVLSDDAQCHAAVTITASAAFSRGQKFIKGPPLHWATIASSADGERRWYRIWPPWKTRRLADGCVRQSSRGLCPRRPPLRSRRNLRRGHPPAGRGSPPPGSAGRVPHIVAGESRHVRCAPDRHRWTLGS